VLAFPSAISSKKELVRAITKIDNRLKISIEDKFIVCSTEDAVKLASKLECTFGIEKVAIAIKIASEFVKISDAITYIGSKTILPGEKFFVKVESNGSNNGFVDRDIQFASTGQLTAKLAEIGCFPAKSEPEADRVILTLLSKRFAYVCIQINAGPGGLPIGSLGSILCNLGGPLSFLSCCTVLKGGFIPEIILTYSDKSELMDIAKLARILAEKGAFNELKLKLAPIQFKNMNNISIPLLNEAIVANVLINQPNDKIVLPLSSAIHPLWFIESIVQKAVLAGKAPYVPLMFIPEDNLYKFTWEWKKELTAMTKNKFKKYTEVIDSSAKLSVNNMKELHLHVGSNYLHDIIDSI